MRTGPRALLVASLAALCACSGGGGSGGGGGGPVTPSALTFTAVVNGSAPAYQDVVLTFPPGPAYIGAVYPPEVPAVTWLGVTDQGGTATTRTFRFQVNTTSLSAATRTTTIRVGTADATGNPIVYGDVQVTYVLKAFGVTPEAVASSYVVGGSAPPTRTVTVGAAAGTVWNATADQTWVHFPSSGTAPSTVTLSFDPTNLATGTHHATVTFTSAAGTSAVGVTFTVSDPTLTVTPGTVDLAGPAGNDLSPKKVQVSLNTGTNAYSWTASTALDWVEIVQTFATVSGAGASFTVRPTDAAAAWPSGNYSGTITVTADVNGTILTRAVPVSYRLEDVRLLVSDDGVALTSTPGPSRLSRSVRVFTSRGVPASWSAQSDQLWLEPTAAGTTGDPLVLTVIDPTVLASDTLHEATVTVTSSDPGVVGEATVRVGLWVGSISPDPITTVAAPYWSVVTDPVRPYAYLATGSSSSIAIYNVHTAAQVGSISIPGATLYAMAVSSDGTRLFAVDEAHHTVVPVDLATWSPGSAWSLPANSRYTRVAFARPDGVPVLLAVSGGVSGTPGSIHDPATGAAYGTFSVPASGGAALILGASRDGSRACTANNSSPYELRCVALDGTTLAGLASPVVVGPARSRSGYGSGGPVTYAHDVALSADGTRAYVASGGANEFTIYDASASSLPVIGGLPAAVYPSSVKVGSDDRIYCGATRASTTSAWIYDAGGGLDASWALGMVSRRQLAPSGDALRIVALTGDGNTSTALSFVTVAP